MRKKKSRERAKQYFEKNKKLYSWCGNYNYKNQLVKFKELLIKKKRELEICREEI